MYSDLDEDLEAEDAEDETEQIETSKMNVMFDLSARLIRRTLKVSGCVLINIETLTDLENIEADSPAWSTIMGACFLKHLRTSDWHEKQPSELFEDGSARSSGSSHPDLQTKSVARSDTFDPRGLSGPWLKQFLEDHPRAASFNEANLPEAIKILLPAGLLSCLLSPIYDSNARAFALIVVFDDKAGDFTKADAHYVEAFGSSIYAEVLNQSLQKANDAKSLFISKISHEFRTPLHGVLASAEFLNDMAETTPTQLGFVQTIDTCGRTLLDIINHVLDYSKLSFSRTVLPVDAVQTEVQFEDFDLVQVAEQVLSTAFSSYEFKRINDHIEIQKTASQPSQSDSDSGSIAEALGRNVEVLVIAKHRPEGYIVHSDLGAYRRMVLNLLGNALKYTLSGHVTLAIRLRAQSEGLEELDIIVSDTGIGIATTFLLEMFRPFTQEDAFSAGTGLGLSIVKELCKKLHGKIDVKSQKQKGSVFTITYPVMSRKPRIGLFPGAGNRRDLEGVQFHFLQCDTENETHSKEDTAAGLVRSNTIGLLEKWYGMVEVPIEDAQILVTDDLAQEFDRDVVLTHSQLPILTLCSTTAKYEKDRQRRCRTLQSFVTKPCGPNRLGEHISLCLTKAQNITRMGENISNASRQSNSELSMFRDQSEESLHAGISPPSSVSSTVRPLYARLGSNITGGERRSIREEQNEHNLAETYSMSNAARITQKLAKLDENDRHANSANSMFSGESVTSPKTVQSPSVESDSLSTSESFGQMDGRADIESSATSQIVNGSRSKKHILIVEDNSINMMLLVAFAKQKSLTVTTAVNGAIALERVKERKRNYDAILMDINMPVMNGFQAIEGIRAHEVAGKRDRAKIVALTGLSTNEDQACAKKAGSDAFFTKPVKMKSLANLLVEWGVLGPIENSPNVRRGSRDTSDVNGSKHSLQRPN